RVLALETEDHRLVGAVPLAGKTEAAEQLDPQALKLRDHAVGDELLREPPCRAHRADRVRARRSDGDLEDGEDGDVHGALSVWPEPAQKRMRVLMLVSSRATAFLTSCDTF